METKEFNSLLRDITLENIHLLERVEDNQFSNITDKKYYKYIPCNEVSENTVYGVVIDNIINFDLKLGQKESFIKTFITQYISKYLSKKYEILSDGTIGQIGKDAAKERLKSNCKGIRLSINSLYSTNYGIGQWIIFDMDIKGNQNIIEAYLNENKIPFRNEYSDERWVYRYILDGSYLDHNQIINNLKTKI